MARESYGKGDFVAVLFQESTGRMYISNNYAETAIEAIEHCKGIVRPDEVIIGAIDMLKRNTAITGEFFIRET